MKDNKLAKEVKVSNTNENYKGCLLYRFDEADQKGLAQNVKKLTGVILDLSHYDKNNFYGKNHFYFELPVKGGSEIYDIYSRYGNVCIGGLREHCTRLTDIVKLIGDGVKVEQVWDVYETTKQPTPKAPTPAKKSTSAKKTTPIEATAPKRTKTLSESEDRLLDELDKRLFDKWAKLYDQFLDDNDFEAIRPQLTKTAEIATKATPFGIKLIKLTQRPFGALFQYYGLAFGYKLRLTEDDEIESAVNVVANQR